MFDTEEDRLIGTAELARLLGCHPVTLYKKLASDPETGEARDPEFPQPIRGIGHRLKWRLSTARAYIEARAGTDPEHTRDNNEGLQ
jgi:predicted DNA-binding transcriptional regulator AlpA